jgi:glycerate 2-kinase
MTTVSDISVAYRPILRAALAVADPDQAVRGVLFRKGNILSAGSISYDLERIRNVRLLAAGKAALPMSRAALDILGDRISGGVVVVPHGSDRSLRRIPVLSSGHPVPDRDGILAAGRWLEEAAAAGPDDLVLVLLSGGASALLPAPAVKLTLGEKQKVTQWLIKSGARINEVNVVRKHLSRIKGGRLAAAIQPAASLTLALSDVLSGDLSTIASGPTYPDASTFEDAVRILRQYRIWTRIPAAARTLLGRGSRNRIPDTPKPGSEVFENARHLIVSDNRRSVEAAEKQARALGFNAMVLTTMLEGEAREVAKVFGAMGREIHRTGHPVSRPACVLAGGELTVTVRGKGRGGRAQEFALAAASQLSGIPDVTVVGFGTDGKDGPTEAAGAVADGTTIERSRKLGLNPVKSLDENDSFPVLKKLGDLILTGPTGTNVNDLYLMILP